MTSWGCLRAGVGTLARRPQGGGPARSVDLYPNAILFTAVPPYEGTNGAAVHSRRTVDAGRGIGRRECDDSERDRRGRGITRERDLGRGNSESRPVSPVLNSDVARKKCVNWGSRGDVAECASLLGSSACWVARRAWIVVRVPPAHPSRTCIAFCVYSRGA